VRAAAAARRRSSWCCHWSCSLLRRLDALLLLGELGGAKSFSAQNKPPHTRARSVFIYFFFVGSTQLGLQSAVRFCCCILFVDGVVVWLNGVDVVDPE